MAIISEIKNSDFDIGKTLNTFSDNARTEITTDGVKEGWGKIKSEIDKSDMVKSIKESPFHIQEKDS